MLRNTSALTTQKFSFTEPEEIEVLFRYFTRKHLKDELRPSLMQIVVGYARRHQLNPRKLCSAVHDQMNISLQGITAKEFRKFNKLPTTCHIRDYFCLELLRYYSSLNELVEELVSEEDVYPVTAVEQVCQRILPRRYKPQVQPISDNINSALGLVMQKRRERERSKARQLHIRGL